VPSGNTLVPSTITKCSLTYGYWLYYWNPNGVSAGTIYIDDVAIETLIICRIRHSGRSLSTDDFRQRSRHNASTTASSAAADSTMENVRFEYFTGGVWKAVGFDYDTTDSAIQRHGMLAV